MIKKFLKKRSLEDYITLISIFAVTFSSIILDPSLLYNGTGFEFPKVEVIRLASLLIIFLGLILEYKKHILGIVGKIVCTVLGIAMILSFIVSINPEVALFGNFFRHQGLLLYLPIALSFVFIYKTFQSKYFNLLLFGVLFAAIVNSFRALLQFRELISDPEKFSMGLYVNGFFGQTNFFSTILLFGIIASAYFLGRKIEVAFKLSHASIIILLTFCMFLSLSRWGILTLAIVLIWLLLYELKFTRILKLTMFCFYIALLPAMVLGSLLFPGYEMHIDIWKKSIISFWEAPIQNKLFGFGFDNVNNVFQHYNLFPGLNVDRAHNFLLDIVLQLGLLAVTGIVVVFGFIIKGWNQIFEDRKNFFLFLMFTMFILKTSVNEYSISNLYMFLMISVLMFKNAFAPKSVIGEKIEA